MFLLVHLCSYFFCLHILSSIVCSAKSQDQTSVDSLTGDLPALDNYTTSVPCVLKFVGLAVQLISRFGVQLYLWCESICYVLLKCFQHI